MDDDIQLPPLPNGVIPGLADWIDAVRRAAVLADREHRAKVDAKPVVHSTTLRLDPDGHAWDGTDVPAASPPQGFLLTLRWTADGRAWIESEQNRELATELRRGSYTHSDLDRAADALYWEPK